MDSISGILESHPRANISDVRQLSETMTELSSCEYACIICADACLSELHVQMLARCIALNLACADACAGAARAVARIGFGSTASVRAHLQLCREACVECAEECKRHGEMEHCQLCATECLSCADQCSAMLESMMSAV